MTTAVCAIVRNEARYVVEWVAYYAAIGVDGFVIYDNGSTDGTVDTVARMAECVPITLISWPPPETHIPMSFGEVYNLIDSGHGPDVRNWYEIRSISPQITAYNHALHEFGGLYDWMLYIDADEFFVPLRDAGIHQFLARFETDPSVSEIAINEKYFGSSGLRTYEDRPVIDRFVRCAAPQFDGHLHVKSFIRPAAVEAMMIHGAKLRTGRCVDDRGETVTLQGYGLSDRISMYYGQINHYSVKSWEEYGDKAKRGRVSMPDTSSEKYEGYGDEYFNRQDRNEDEDWAIQRFLGAVRHNMNVLNTAQEANAPSMGAAIGKQRRADHGIALG